MVVLKHSLIVIKYRKFRDVFGLKHVVGAGVVHVVGGSGNEGYEDLEIAEVARLLDSLHFDHLGEVLGDVRGVDLRVTRIIPVRFL